jgi:hypothetical protein
VKAFGGGENTSGADKKRALDCDETPPAGDVTDHAWGGATETSLMDADFPVQRGGSAFLLPALRLTSEQQQSMSDQSTYTVDEFCRAERISRSFLYKLWALDQGPRWYAVGAVRRISHEARLERRRRLEAETSSDGGTR